MNWVQFRINPARCVSC